MPPWARIPVTLSFSPVSSASGGAAPLLGVVHLTGAGDLRLTPPVHIHRAGLTSHPLADQAVQQRPTVLAEGGPPVAVDFKLVLVLGVIGVGPLACAPTGKSHKLVAPLVNRKAAELALVALLPKPPDEAGAVAAEGGLLEQLRGEPVALHLVHFLLSPSAGEAAGGGLGLGLGCPGVFHGPSSLGQPVGSAGEQQPGGRGSGKGCRWEAEVPARSQGGPAAESRAGLAEWELEELARWQARAL